jgi:hypothetical protein
MREALENIIDDAADNIERDAHLDGTTERNTRVLAERRSDLAKAREALDHFADAGRMVPPAPAFDDWTVGEVCTYHGFFNLGWDAALLASRQGEANGCNDCKYWAPDDCKHPENQLPNDRCKFGELHTPRNSPESPDSSTSETAPERGEALAISAYLHRLPRNERGHEIGIMEVGYDAQGQLSYGPFWLSQPETDKIMSDYFARAPRPEASGEVVYMSANHRNYLESKIQEVEALRGIIADALEYTIDDGMCLTCGTDPAGDEGCGQCGWKVRARAALARTPKDGEA